MGELILILSVPFIVSWVIARLLAGGVARREGVDFSLFGAGAAGAVLISALLWSAVWFLPNSLGRMRDSTDCSGIYNFLGTFVPGEWLGAAAGMTFVLRHLSRDTSAGLFSAGAGLLPAGLLLSTAVNGPERASRFALTPVSFDTTLLLCALALALWGACLLAARRQHIPA